MRSHCNYHVKLFIVLVSLCTQHHLGHVKGVERAGGCQFMRTFYYLALSQLYHIQTVSFKHSAVSATLKGTLEAVEWIQRGERTLGSAFSSFRQCTLSTHLYGHWFFVQCKLLANVLHQLPAILK